MHELGKILRISFVPILVREKKSFSFIDVNRIVRLKSANLNNTSYVTNADHTDNNRRTICRTFFT